MPECAPMRRFHEGRCAASTKEASDDEGTSGAGHSNLVGDVLGVARAQSRGAQGPGVVEHSQPVIVLQEGGDKHLRDAGRGGDCANGAPHPYLLEYPLRHRAAGPFEGAAGPAPARRAAPVFFFMEKAAYEMRGCDWS